MPPLALTWPDAAALDLEARVMLALVLGLLGATVVVMRPGGGTPALLRAQVRSWWFLLPPVFAAWALHPVGVPALVLLISALAARDLALLSERAPRGGLGWRFAALWALQAALATLGLAAWNVALMLALAAVYGGVWHVSGGARREALLQALFAAQAAGLWCLVAMAPGSMPPRESAAWFLYLCVVTAINDIGQYLIGSRFGRHKLAARVSPNKTWQGLAGGLVFSMGASLCVGQALGLASPGWLCGMGLVLSVAGLLGDLMFSAGKRRLGIKDYSRLIPGHGGILDRVDSLVLTAPALLIALRLA